MFIHTVHILFANFISIYLHIESISWVTHAAAQLPGSVSVAQPAAVENVDGVEDRPRSRVFHYVIATLRHNIAGTWIVC